MLRLETQNQSLLNDVKFTLLFGVLSMILSKVQFYIPGIGNSDLREIPLLICLFHVSNPLLIPVLCFFTLFGSHPGVPDWMAYVVHLVPLLIAGAAFKLIERRSLSSTVMGLTWMLATVGYYLLLLPLVALAVSFVPENSGKDLWAIFRSILPPIRFELVSSSLVTGLYLMQMEIRKTLENQNRNLEQIIEQRTKEIIKANNDLQSLNEELTASNEGIKSLNENLEQLVKERTEKINVQLSQLRRYAYMNSHDLRAPLARMLGLLELMKDDPSQVNELQVFLHESSKELDNIVREMNRLLQKEITVDEQ
jgi:signal transduction histidine kinase